MPLASGTGYVPGIPNWLSIVVLVLEVLTLIFVWTGRKRFTVKIVWTLIVLFVPLLGLVLYFLLGREKS